MQDNLTNVIGLVILKKFKSQSILRACGGMVDTLVLGTSAQAWEFESLHAQIAGYN